MQPAELTLGELCADMAASGRRFTRELARDWWARGLLPRPRRRGLGPGKGTKTYWTEPGIRKRAQAVHDLLAAYPRADTDVAILNMWLRGFAEKLNDVRAIYERRIDRHLREICDQTRLPLHDAVGKLGEEVARQIAATNLAPTEVRYAIDDLLTPFLEVFYGVDNEIASTGLATLWTRVAPYLGHDTPHKDWWIKQQIRDEDFEIWARHLKENASLATQREAVSSATDYELIRARRLVLLVSGYLGRVGRASSPREHFHEFVDVLLMAFAQPAIPILISVFRKDELRHKAVSALLDFLKMMPRGAGRWKELKFHAVKSPATSPWQGQFS